jgi:hypothetical protein
VASSDLGPVPIQTLMPPPGDFNGEMVHPAEEDAGEVGSPARTAAPKMIQSDNIPTKRTTTPPASPLLRPSRHNATLRRRPIISDLTVASACPCGDTGVATDAQHSSVGGAHPVSSERTRSNTLLAKRRSVSVSQATAR